MSHHTENINSIIHTAAEGGINYWCFASRRIGGALYNPDECLSTDVVTLHLSVGLSPSTVDHTGILMALADISQGKVKVNWDIRKTCILVLTTIHEEHPLDMEKLDCEVADVIVQVAALGEIVYG